MSTGISIVMVFCVALTSVNSVFMRLWALGFGLSARHGLAKA
jgi:hypothetical protein